LAQAGTSTDGSQVPQPSNAEETDLLVHLQMLKTGLPQSGDGSYKQILSSAVGRRVYTARQILRDFTVGSGSVPLNTPVPQSVDGHCTDKYPVPQSVDGSVYRQILVPVDGQWVDADKYYSSVGRRWSGVPITTVPQSVDNDEDNDPDAGI